MIRIKIPKIKEFDPFYWRIPRFQYALLELIREWYKEGFIHLEETGGCFCLWNDDVLLFDYDQTQFVCDQKSVKTWKGRYPAHLTLFGNEKPVCDFFHRSWIYWAYRPKQLEQFIIKTGKISYDSRKLDLIFAGRSENDCQEVYRRKATGFLHYVQNTLSTQFNFVCEVRALTRNENGEIPKYAWNQDEYLSNISSSRFGLCIRGNGPACYREIEYLATGTVPILTPGCIMHYHARLEKNLHYFEADVPNDLVKILHSVKREQWERCSEAGKAWYWINASLRGSFDATRLQIHDFYEQKKKGRICHHVFCYMTTTFDDWLSTLEQIESRYLEVKESPPKIWILLHTSASDNVDRIKIPVRYCNNVIYLNMNLNMNSILVNPSTLPDIHADSGELVLFLGGPCVVACCPILHADENTWWLSAVNCGLLEWSGKKWTFQNLDGKKEYCMWYDCWTELEIVVPTCLSLSLSVLQNVHSECRRWFLKQGDPFYRELGYQSRIRIRDIYILWTDIQVWTDGKWQVVRWNKDDWKKTNLWINSGMKVGGYWSQPDNFPFAGKFRISWNWDESRSVEDYGKVPPVDTYYFELSSITHVVLPFMVVEKANLIQGIYNLDCKYEFHGYFLKQLWNDSLCLQITQLENLRNLGCVWKLGGMSECKEDTFFHLLLVINGKSYELNCKLRFEAYLLSNYAFDVTKIAQPLYK